MKLAGSMNSKEIKSLKRLQSELEGAGYDVREIALAADGQPAAIVARKEDSKTPLRVMIASARTLLRAVEEVDIGEAISPEESETLSATCLTLRIALEKIKVRKVKKLGGIAHQELAKTIQRAEDELDD